MSGASRYETILKLASGGMATVFIGNVQHRSLSVNEIHLYFLVDRPAGTRYLQFDPNIVTREDILDRVWGYEVFPSTRTVDNFIVRLRKRFERNPEQPAHFHTVRGVGYRFTRAPTRDAEKPA